MEDYAAKMLLKTDAALREYVTGHVQYREAAVLAALDELRRRGQPAPEEAALRPALEAGAAAQRTLEEAAEAERRRELPASVSDDAEADENTPALYSPVTIVLFSIPFTLLAGAVLLGLNLWRLGRKRALLSLAVFIVAYLLVGMLALSWALPRYGLSPWYGPLFNLPAILAYVLWFWPRYVGQPVYRNRSWLPPLLVCFALAYGAQRFQSYMLQQQPKEVQQEFERMMPKQ
ncbi:hypothetical protein [Hymenobacter negativus]|uniref:Uncharacterized protein n=1 Tax=Hymenobacter negativus TaxID=2795026 RepID=A0ABS0Q7Y6_9BACT|nr:MULTISPECIES: hypothetical protein [Bacteria]MBH8558787.1 hypothetical protein [Hymenobacter negativus]MBH8570322.1 hypothetical protein [Hymenobacter negativus]MBR7210061.1 hypothetical protein [Microvirga sp. STS02]